MIKILHLYYDLMNLYGESGNIKVLTKYLELQKVKYQVDLLTIGDKVDFNKYDFIFIGAGTERNQKIALRDLITKKDSLKTAINNNKHILLTGNSYEMLGSKITTNNKEEYEGLNIFKFNTTEVNKRIVGNIYYTSKYLKNKLIGFENRSSKNDYEGYFNASDGTKEGIKHKNLIGTYMIGPILVKNPELLHKIVNSILKEKKITIKKYQEIKLQKKAYDDFINSYIDIKG